jgi:hypothetical protein
MTVAAHCTVKSTEKMHSASRDWEGAEVTALNTATGPSRRQESLVSAMPSRPAIIVLDADDIVLPEIAAGLNLDQLKHDLAGIFQPVHRAGRDIDRFIHSHARS